MTVCNIVGCACQGTGETHHPLKAYEGGYRYFAASYGPRFGDPQGTYVALIVGRAEDAAERAAEWERNELPSYCEDEACKGDCAFCDPDVTTWGESTYSAKDLFTAAELKKHRRDLLAGKVVCLSR